jgi:hypothetical protein
MKCIACPKTGCMLNLEIHWREDGKKTLIIGLEQHMDAHLRMIEDTV